MGRARSGVWLSAGAALAVGLLLRLWFISHPPVFAGDAVLYGTIARNLLQHGVYGFNEYTSAHGVLTVESTLIRLPGYPLFLVACFRLFGIENYRAVLCLQVLADLVTCGLCAGLAGRLFGRSAVLPVLWLAALCPFTANYTAGVLTETLVLLTIALAFYSFARWCEAENRWGSWLWIVAGALAYSIVLRPEDGLLAAAVLPGMFWVEIMRRRAAGRAGLLIAVAPVMTVAVCAVLPLMPWALRNWKTFHVIEPLAPRSAADPGEMAPVGFNEWFRTWGIDFASSDEVYWNMEGAPIYPADLPPRAYSLRCEASRGAAPQALPLYSATVALLNEYDQTLRDSPSLEARFAELAKQKTHAAPLCTGVLLPLARLANMLLRPRLELLAVPDRWWKAPATRRQTGFALGYGALNAVYLGIGIFGFVEWWRHRKWRWRVDEAVVWSMLATLLLRAALLLTLDNSEPRYTLEYFPVLFVWAGGWFATRRRPQGHGLHEGEEGEPL